MTDLTLTIAEERTLARHEAVIIAGQKHFVAVGNALAAIRDARLYRGEFATFPDYCREKWGFNKTRAYQFIEAAIVVEEVSTIGGRKPTNERQARALADVPVEARKEVWQAAVEEAAPKPPTARRIAETAARLKPEPEAEYEADEPGELVDEAPPAKPEPNAIGEAFARYDAFVAQLIDGKPAYFVLAMKEHSQTVWSGL